MSRDIRSFFSVVSKKSGSSASSSTPSKKRIIIDSDDDIIEASPISPKKQIKHKKRKVIDSDSEDESNKTPKIKRIEVKSKKKEELKPVNASDLFGNAPIKQSKVPEKKKSNPRPKQNDEDFEKTLQQLDDDIMIDDDILDKTIDEAIKNDEKKKSTNENAKTPKKTPRKKENADDSLYGSGLDPDQERYEKRRHSALLYKQYLNRGTPEHKGKKEMPKGKPDCLKNLCFMKTGLLDSMEKVDVDAIVKEHGGRTVSAVSRKVNYIIVGTDPGPSKIEKAKNLGIPEITEDEFLDLILVKSGLPPRYAQKDDSEEPVTKKSKFEDELRKEKTSPKKEKQSSSPKKTPEKPSLNKGKEKSSSSKGSQRSTSSKNLEKSSDKLNLKKLNGTEMKKDSKEKKREEKSEIVKEEKVTLKSPKKSPKKLKEFKPFERTIIETPKENVSWTDKYKPKELKSIIGQQGDKSCMKKLLFWLQNWHKNHTGKNKPKLVRPSPWAKSDDGAYFKCALLSGPPGIGKTTTATLVAKELKFDVIEYNASDTRSKKLLHEEVSQLLNTTSVANFIKDGSASSKKHVLLMDEVDGMAGNEDRGGMQELIALIKNTNVPIVCMCNDRQHPKIRSLVNYCFDLRFNKPRPEQLKGALMSICYKENLKISSDALLEIIKGTDGDIRQTLNNLSLWTATEKNLSSSTAENEAKNAKKDTVLGPWEVIRQVFSEQEHKNMSLIDKSKLFFYDYSIAPLFVQENYLTVVPHCPKNEVLKRVAQTAEALSMGDVIDNRIRSSNNWSLLDSEGFFMSVLPGHYMEGHFGGQINFPSWLGKNSKRTKFSRLLSEVQSHMRTNISGAKDAVNLDYIYHIRDRIVSPLAQEGTAGVEKSLKTMTTYSLLREDLDSILELSQWPKQKDPMAMVDSKVKAAFTRMYNKTAPALPYSSSTVGIKKKATSQESETYGDEEDVESDDNDDDISKDAMIKEKKKAAPKAKKETAEASTSRKTSTKAKPKKAK